MTVPPPPSLLLVADQVSRRLEDLLGQERTRWAAVDPALVDPLDALRAQLAAGGKRLRPAFATWAFGAAGGDVDAAEIVDAAAAVELLHAFALAHDDVMDRSPARRGQPTLHVSFAAHHRAEGWIGDAVHFGQAVAILVGDLAYAYADTLMGAPGPRVAEIWHEMRIEVNIGQYLDVVAEARGAATAEQARRIVEYKTGRYSVVRPLQLGVALAGGSPQLHDGLSAYGHPVGMAFQLRDDMLGAFGDETLTGKPVGDDLRQGKRTPLLAAARERVSGHARRLLDQVGQTELSGAALAEVQAVLHESGAVAQIESEIAGLTDRAIAILTVLDLAPPAATALEELARYVADRPS